MTEVFVFAEMILLNKGIVNDETNGHVDNICNFVKEDEVVLAWPKDENNVFNYKNIIVAEIENKIVGFLLRLKKW